MIALGLLGADLVDRFVHLGHDVEAVEHVDRFAGLLGQDIQSRAATCPSRRPEALRALVGPPYRRPYRRPRRCGRPYRNRL